MILYITNEAGEDALNFLDETELQVRVWREPDMAVKMRKELPYLGAVKAIIVNADGIDRTTWQEAATLLQTAHPTPLLLLDNQPDEVETWRQEDGYVVLNQAHRAIEEEVLRWLAGEPVTKSRTWIAVAGLTPSVGTTSLAMHIAGYIAKRGREAAVTELGSLFPELADAYGWNPVSDGCWNWGGVRYCSGGVDESMRYTVFDCGLIGEKVYGMMDKCEIKILVADGKPYRLRGLNHRLAELRELSGKIILVFTFVPEADKPKLKSQYTSEDVSVWFAPYAPDLFETSGEYQTLLTGYIEPPEPAKKKLKLSGGRVKNKGQPRKKAEKPKKEKAVKPAKPVKVKPEKPVKVKSEKVKPEKPIRTKPEKPVRIKPEKPKKERKPLTLPRIPKKVWIIAGGSIGAAACLFFLGSGIYKISQSIAAQEPEVISAEHVPLKDMNRSDGIAASFPEATTEEATIEAPATEEATETTTEAEATTEAEKQTTTKQTTAEPTTAAPAAEAATEAPSTESGGKVAVTVRPSLSGYNGQIYTGAEVQTIINQYAGSSVSTSVTTRDGSGVIDPSCSFFCQVVYTGGEETGLNFIQQ